MIALRHGLALATRTIFWILVTVAAQSLLWVDGIPVALKALVILTGILAVWRPSSGLLVVAALVPFASVMTSRVFEANDLVLAEGLVLAFLSGWFWPGAPARQQPLDGVSRPAWLFALVVAASIAVQFALERAWQDLWPRFLDGSARYLATEYLTAHPDVRPQVPGLGFFPPAMAWIEGVAVLLAARALCRRQPQLLPRLLATMTVAATGVALLSWYRIFDLASQGGTSPLELAASPLTRMTSAIPSIGGSASYFLMTSLAGLGLAIQSSRVRMLGWIAAAIVITSAGWLTKMRAVMLTWLSVVGAVTAWVLALRLRVGRRGALVLGGVIAVVVFAGVLAANPFGLLRTDRTPLQARGILARGTVAMIQANPLFGVGIRQFKLRYPEFRPPDWPDYIEDDPHNHLLGVAAELGFVGLATFVWFLTAAFVEAASVLRVAPIHWPRLGALAGCAAFFLTCLSHEPLFVLPAGLSFWILLGAAAGSGPPRPATPTPRSWIPAAIFAVAAVAIAISVPIRARSAIGEINFTKVSYGFYEWEVDGAGHRFRWTTHHVALFLPASMSLVNLPVSASRAGAPNGVDIEIRIAGKHTGQLHLTDEEWHDVRLVAPATRDRAWRVDLYVSPTFYPNRINPAVDDGRELGIRVGEPSERTTR